MGEVQIPKLLSTRELAGALKVSPRTIHKWVSRAAMPQPLRVGGLLRWEPAAIIEWLLGPRGV